MFGIRGAIPSRIISCSLRRSCCASSGCTERLNRAGLVLVDVENLEQVGNLQHLSHSRSNIRQLQLAATIPNRLKALDQLANAAGTNGPDWLRLNTIFLRPFAVNSATTSRSSVYTGPWLDASIIYLGTSTIVIPFTYRVTVCATARSFFTRSPTLAVYSTSFRSSRKQLTHDCKSAVGSTMSYFIPSLASRFRFRDGFQRTLQRV